ncbi:MAG: thioesterase family protein [Ginsengibacter sp.]
MYTASTTIRVHYALTDQMGVVYYGNYAQFYEIGRTEALRQLGFTYKSIEAMGIFMAVTDMHIRFLRPALYDDLLTVTITLKELPEHHKIIFDGAIFNEKKELLNTGVVTLYFIDAVTKKRAEMPAEIKDRLRDFF